MVDIQKNHRFVSVVGLAILIGTGFTGRAAQKSTLDSILRPDSLGNPAVDLALPEQVSTDAPAWRIALMGRTPMGFEGADAGQHTRLGEFHCVDLTGASVRDALNLLVRADPRYVWRELNGVPVVRPINAWTDATNPLNQPVANLAWDNVSAEQALSRVAGLVFRRQVPANALQQSHDGRLLSVHVELGSVIDVLNEVVRAHGDLMWSVTHGISAENPTGLRVSLKWFDGHAVRTSFRDGG